MKTLHAFWASALLASCSATIPKPASYLAEANPTPATKISAGMSTNDVTGIMGNPSGMNTSIFRSEHFCHAYSYSAGGVIKYLWVDYDDNAVIAYKDGQLGSSCFFPEHPDDML